MNAINDAISRSVRMKLRSEGMSIERCCLAFNEMYFREIESGHLKPLNKDFVSRVSRNAFKIPSDRVLKLCEFLEIENNYVEQDQLRILSDQILKFKLDAERNSEFSNRYSSLLRFLTGLNLEKMLDGC